MRDAHLRNGVFMLIDKELKNINPNLEEVSRTPGGGWYIKSKEESWYVQSLIADELARDEDMNEWLSDWNGGLGIKVECIEDIFSKQRCFNPLNSCENNCRKNSIVSILDKYVDNDLSIGTKTPKNLFEDVRDCLCPACRAEVGLLVYYVEILDVESLIRQGYFNRFLNRFIKYENLGEKNLSSAVSRYSLGFASDRGLAVEYNKAKTKILGGIFNLDNFYRWVATHKEEYFKSGRNGESDKITVVKEWTTPVAYSAPGVTGGRKNYKLPNLFSYANSAFYIDENKDKIIDIFLDNKRSLSKFLDCPIYTNQIKDELKTSLLIGGDKRYTVELQNFPGSMYTHSLEWMLGGKLEAKRSLGRIKEGNLKFGADLDTLMQISQNGETHGLPQGSLVSQVIAEMYMCKFDEFLSDRINIPFSRNVSSVTFAYNTDYDLANIKRAVHDVSGEYSLRLDDINAKEEHFPFANMMNKDLIINYFKEHPVYFGMENTPKSICGVESFVREKIYKFIDFCSFEEKRGNRGSLKLMISVLVDDIRNGSIASLVKDNFDNLEDGCKSIRRVFLSPGYISNLSIFEKILDISLAYPEITQDCIDFSQYLIDMYQEKKNAQGYPLGVYEFRFKRETQDMVNERVNAYFSKVNQGLSNKINYLLEQKHSQELHSLLTLFIVFDYDILHQDEEEVERMCKSIVASGIDDINLILATIIYYRKFGNFDELLEVAARVLWRTHSLVCPESDLSTFDPNKRYMRLCSCGQEFSGELWLYRYYLYSLNSGRGSESFANSLESGRGSMHSSFKASLKKIKDEKRINLNRHFMFRLKKSELKRRMESKKEKRGMIVHKFYREMLDSGVRIVN